MAQPAKQETRLASPGRGGATGVYGLSWVMQECMDEPELCSAAPPLQYLVNRRFMVFVGGLYVYLFLVFGGPVEKYHNHSIVSGSSTHWSDRMDQNCWRINFHAMLQRCGEALVTCLLLWVWGKQGPQATRHHRAIGLYIFNIKLNRCERVGLVFWAFRFLVGPGTYMHIILHLRGS